MSEAALAAGRQAAEQLMVDIFALTRPTGEGTVYDSATQSEAEATSSLGTSVGKIQSRSLVVTEAEVAGRTAGTVRIELHLPVTAPALRRGDLATMTATGPMTPAALIGRRLRVVGPVGKTWATAMRYEVEEVVS